MKLYVASSWRNAHQPDVVRELRAAGHDVYDFRNPGPGERGFAWSEIDPAWQSWTPARYREALAHPTAEHGFGLDLGGMQRADAGVLVLPCGRSAHLEAGWLMARGRPVFVLALEACEPELMYKLGDEAGGRIVLSIRELIGALAALRVDAATADAEASRKDEALFRGWIERISRLYDATTDEGMPRLELIHEIHADVASRHPLGIARQLSQVLDCLGPRPFSSRERRSVSARSSRSSIASASSWSPAQAVSTELLNAVAARANSPRPSWDDVRFVLFLVAHSYAVWPQRGPEPGARVCAQELRLRRLRRREWTERSRRLREELAFEVPRG